MGKRQKGARSAKLSCKGKTLHGSDGVLLTIPGLCCSSSMLLRIMQALVTLPRRERDKEEHTLNGITTLDPISELWAKGKQWGQNNSPSHISPIAGVKGRPPHNGPFCSCHILQGFRSKLWLPRSSLQAQVCAAWLHIGMVPLWSLTLLPKLSCPRRDSAFHRDCGHFCQQSVEPVYPDISYQHYPAIAKYR